MVPVNRGITPNPHDDGGEPGATLVTRSRCGRRQTPQLRRRFTIHQPGLPIASTRSQLSRASPKCSPVTEAEANAHGLLPACPCTPCARAPISNYQPLRLLLFNLKHKSEPPGGVPPTSSSPVLDTILRRAEIRTQNRG